MALIGKIRNNIWIVVVLIALGVGGFIIMDMTAGQQSVFGSNQAILAEINGNKVDINEFSRREQALYSGSTADPYSQRNAVWNFYLEKYILEEEAEAIGLGVSRDELLDLQFGANLSPIITSIFKDPATGQVNREQLNSFRDAIQNRTLDPTLRPFWAAQEQEIIKERIKEKLLNLSAKAMYVPTWQAEMFSIEQNTKMDFLYVRIPYDQVNNSEIALSDDDYKAYLKEKGKQYEQTEETRKVEYVVFNVNATAEDSAAQRQVIADLIPEFAASENDSLFVQSHFGELAETYFGKEILSPAIADTVFKAPIGSVVGPYGDPGAFKAAKVYDRKMIPDSVRARHILIQANGQDMQAAQLAYNTIDSLKNLIESGASNFDSLAAQFGQDGTASKGGDLGFFSRGAMVAEFENLCFYRAEPGKLYIVGTQFGIHLVEVTDRKFITNTEGVRLAIIQEKIQPSEKTRATIEERALDLIEQHSSIEDLRKAIASDPNLQVVVSPALRENDFSIRDLGTGVIARRVVRWAFGDEIGMDDPSIGDVCPEVFAFQNEEGTYTNKFAIVALKTIQKAGIPSVEGAKEEIEQAVINRKKFEYIQGKLGGNTQNLQAIASQFGVSVDTAAAVSFSSGFIPGVGAEPKVVAQAFNVGQNAVSGVLEGNTGAYVIMPINNPGAPATPPNTADIKKSTLTTLESQVKARLMNALKKNADVDDYRSRHF